MKLQNGSSNLKQKNKYKNMKPSKFFHALFPFIIITIPWLYVAIIWNDLPATIPTHFGISGAPDNYGQKNEIVIAPAILTGVGILMYFLLNNLYRIDPKKKYAPNTSALLSKLAVVVIILMCAVSLFVCYWTLKGKVVGMPIFFCGMSLFIAYIGNLMHSIKPNYFAGFRLLWTLENEENWRKTHQLASKIWFCGGIILAIISLLHSLQIVIIVFMSSILVMSIIPAFYSYKLYKQTSKSNHLN
jgi:uncharacterized membrane protein